MSLRNVSKERDEMCLKKEPKMKEKVYSPPSRWKVIVLTGHLFVCVW